MTTSLPSGFNLDDNGLISILDELAMRFGDTCKIYGLDSWETAADRAREKIISFGIKNVELLDGIAIDIVPDNQVHPF